MHQPKYVGPEYQTNPLAPIAAGKTGQPEVLTGAGAISLDTENTDLALSAGADVAFTLARGDEFQRKSITMSAKGAGNGVITVTGLAGGTTLTFNAVADVIVLQYLSGSWRVILNVSVVLA